MKLLVTLILSVFTSSGSLAQSVYESPCVVDGKTFQVSIPEGFHKVKFTGLARTTFTTIEGLGPYSPEMTESELGKITIAYKDRNVFSLDEFFEDMNTDRSLRATGLEFTSKPQILTINGQRMLFAGYRGKIDEKSFKAIYAWMFEFGEHVILASYSATKQLEEVMSFENFKDMFSSLKVVETDKQDEFKAEQELFEEELRGYTGYQNELFETEIHHADIIPNDTESWFTPFSENKYLLDEYSYKDGNGFIYIFSGGKLTNYPDELTMEKAIQSALESSDQPKIEFTSICANDRYSYKEYKVSGFGSVLSVYTTEIKNELVFLIVDEGRNTISGFKSAAHDFILDLSFHAYENKPEEEPIDQE